MKNIKLLVVLTIAMAGVNRTYGQSDSTRRKNITYMSRYLQTDTLTASKVNEARDAYKRAAKAIWADQSLSDLQKQLAIDSLADVKNHTLERLLPAAVLDKVIPTTERRRNWKRDSTVTNR